MLGNDMIAKERVGDLLRQAEAERRSHQVTRSRAVHRRGGMRAAVGSVLAAMTPRRGHVAHPLTGR
jgi:hypothetical protein